MYNTNRGAATLTIGSGVFTFDAFSMRKVEKKAINNFQQSQYDHLLISICIMLVAYYITVKPIIYAFESCSEESKIFKELYIKKALESNNRQRRN